jgi:hypothetical protein
MGSVGALVLQIEPDQEGDDDELAELTQRLRTDLLDLDVESVDPLRDDKDPEGSKGLGVLIGWLTVRLDGLDRLRAVVGAVAAWASRTGHSVEITLGGDTLKVTGVTAGQQERLIDDFLARHAPDR